MNRENLQLIPVDELRPGDLVDVEGDAFAGSYVAAEFELLEVAFTERETPGCQLVGFEGFDWVGFPIGHKLSTVRREDIAARRSLIGYNAAS